MNKDKVPALSEGPFRWSCKANRRKSLEEKQGCHRISRSEWELQFLLHTEHVLMPRVYTNTHRGWSSGLD